MYVAAVRLDLIVSTDYGEAYLTELGTQCSSFCSDMLVPNIRSLFFTPAWAPNYVMLIPPKFLKYFITITDNLQLPLMKINYM